MSARAVFRVTVDARGELDRELCRLRELTLERHGDDTFVLCDAPSDEVAARVARAGLRTEPDAAPPPRDGWLVPAVMSDLRPRAAVALVDRITLRALTEGEALTRTLRPRFLRLRRERSASARARSLLRGADVMYAWRRVVWATPSALRGPSLRGARPIVFDRDAVEHGPPRYGLVSDCALAAWLVT